MRRPWARTKTSSRISRLLIRWRGGCEQWASFPVRATRLDEAIQQRAQKPHRRADPRARALISHQYCNVQFTNARRSRMNNGTTATPRIRSPFAPPLAGRVERSGPVGCCRRLRHGSQRREPMACSTAQQSSRDGRPDCVVSWRCCVPTVCGPCAVEALCRQSLHQFPPCGKRSGLRSGRRFWVDSFSHILPTGFSRSYAIARVQIV